MSWPIAAVMGVLLFLSMTGLVLVFLKIGVALDRRRHGRDG